MKRSGAWKAGGPGIGSTCDERTGADGIAPGGMEGRRSRRTSALSGRRPWCVRGLRSQNAHDPLQSRQVVLPPCSLRLTRLSHSEMVGDAAGGTPDRSPPTARPRGASLCRNARGLAPLQTPRGMKLAGEGARRPCGAARARPALCGSMGRTRRLDVRRDHTGTDHRVRKESHDATERHHDAWGGGDRA